MKLNPGRIVESVSPSSSKDIDIFQVANIKSVVWIVVVEDTTTNAVSSIKVTALNKDDTDPPEVSQDTIQGDISDYNLSVNISAGEMILSINSTSSNTLSVKVNRTAIVS